MAILLGLPIFVLRDTYNVVSFVSKEGFTRDDKILVWKVDLGAFYIFYKILYLLIYLFIFFFFRSKGQPTISNMYVRTI